MMQWLPVALAVTAMIIIVVNIYLSKQEEDTRSKHEIRMPDTPPILTPVAEVVEGEVQGTLGTNRTQRSTDNPFATPLSDLSSYETQTPLHSTTGPPSHILGSGVPFQHPKDPDQLTQMSESQMRAGQNANRKKKVRYGYERIG